MEKMKDNDLAQCVSVGGWLRGTAAVTSRGDQELLPPTAPSCCSSRCW